VDAIARAHVRVALARENTRETAENLEALEIRVGARRV
jgi:hypothetical protein